MKVFSLAMAGMVLESASGKTFFKETFSGPDPLASWTMSQTKSGMGKFTVGSGEFYGDEDINQGMITSEDLKFYGISKKLDEAFSNKDKDLVVQFSVKHEKGTSSHCGGGYIKLLPSDTDLANFGGDSPYHIMFGPDLCGYDVSRIHAIFGHKGENLLRKPDISLTTEDKTEHTHVYTFVVKPDQTYEVLLDGKSKAKGELFKDWGFPQKTMDDPESRKPEDWVEDPTMPDESDVKPEGWDDIPETIVEPDASMPDDWDEEDDGEWEAPMIDNPEYQGEWKQKRIKNPEYKGPWAPDQIPNPDYEDTVYVYDDIGAVGFELWVVNGGSVFDNIYVGDSLEEANAFMDETYGATIEKEKAAKNKLDEADAKASEEAESALPDDFEDEDDALPPDFDAYEDEPEEKEL